ncbi:MAG: ATP-binding protein [Pseudomonadota bacterium]
MNAPLRRRRALVQRRLLPVLITLGVLIAGQVAAFVTLGSLMNRQEEQRRLSQSLFSQRTSVAIYVRHTQVALFALAISDWELLIRERRGANEIADRYERTARALLAREDTKFGATAQPPPQLKDAQLRALLEESNRRWERLRFAATSLLRSDVYELKGNGKMAEFVPAIESIVTALEAALKRNDELTAASSRALARAQYAVPSSSLLLVLLLALFVYHRSILPLDHSIRELESSEAEVLAARDLLEARVLERTAELERATRAIHESETRLQNILDNSTAVVYVKDVEGRYLLINREYERLFHVTSEQMRSRTDLDVFSQDVAELLRENDAKALRSGGAIQLEEIIPQDDGVHHYVSIKFPLFDAAGRAYGVCGISTDLTELKRAEEQLRHAQKMDAIGRLAGGIAHDFNNLLTVINGYSSMLVDELEPGDPSRDRVADILEAGERASTLTRQILAYSRKQVLEPNVWNLNAIVAEMTSMIGRLVGEDVSLATSLVQDPSLVLVDRGQVEQIILNLVVNARDAMPHGGKLTIETGLLVLDDQYVSTHLEVKPGPHVMLAVTDTGQGMSQEVSARVFEPFFTTKEVGKGTGLGLSVVFGIVKQSGGSISVYSELGVGTTFRIYFPQVVEAGAEQSLAHAVTQEIALLRGSETILLVEDEEAVRVFAASVLRRQGYVVLEAHNGLQALELLERTEAAVCLLVTDVVMPEMGGPALVARLRELRPTLPVLYMSGYAERAVVHNGLVKSKQAFLQKPFTPIVLARKIREVLDKGAAC